MTKRASAVPNANGPRAEAGLAKTRAVIAAGALGLAMMVAPAVSAFAGQQDKAWVCHYGGGTYQVQKVGDPATGNEGHTNHPKDFFSNTGESLADFTVRCEAANPTPSTTTTTTTTTSAPATSTTTEPSQTSTTTEPSQTSTTSTTTSATTPVETTSTTTPVETTTTSAPVETTSAPVETTTTTAPVETTTTSAPVETTTRSAPVTTTTSAPVQTTTTDVPDTGAVGTSTATTRTATGTVTVAASTAAGVETAAQAKKLAYTGSTVWHPLTLAGAMLFIGALLLLASRHVVVERRH